MANWLLYPLSKFKKNPKFCFVKWVIPGRIPTNSCKRDVEESGNPGGKREGGGGGRGTGPKSPS